MKKWIAFSLIVTFAWACQSNKQPESIAKEESLDQSSEPTLAMAQEITGASFAALSSQLGAHMKSGGVAAAIDYCSLQAMPLTDSLSSHFGVSIKRTALRLRNPQNKPTTEERAMLEKFEQMMLDGNQPKPVLTQNEQGEWRYFQPILLMPLCSKCHGDVNSQIAPADLDLIRAAYPADEAVNFMEGDIRGMWSLTF